MQHHSFFRKLPLYAFATLFSYQTFQLSVVTVPKCYKLLKNLNCALDKNNFKTPSFGVIGKLLK